MLRAIPPLIRVNPRNQRLKFPAWHIHLADHGPVPTGSSHPLSPATLTQAGNKSYALAEGARCDGKRFIALRADNQAADATRRQISGS